MGAPRSALTGFEARVRLVDDVNTPLAPHQTVVTVTITERPQGVTDLHDETFGANV
jgi:hypothetical protein